MFNPLKPSQEINPSILYYGTPVILLSSWNEDGTTNLSPLSSSWALGRSIVLGIGQGGQALANLQERPDCVINVPGPDLWPAVERLAPFTGKEEVPAAKAAAGFTYKKDKFETSNLTPVPSISVQAARIAECPLQIEACVRKITNPSSSDSFAIVETEAIRIHAHPDILLNERHVDPAKWSPLIYNFRHYFGLGEELGKTFRSET
ncbi:flavin reductase family protein [Paenibacillus sp. JX-17]|uniref:Flavin reductase family protein n=1 Tax=Paenibacillus lacisoli TaxID=3064525 RepID=A0ABT9C8G5_9BACL|nr:flavin reductase family protein [Paenibacillus sp. JX-17]MDO7905556.1 flavin reductase family protein [Paenibacillus sp. JX-17]